ncbi:hypothetical protein PAXRUDRAFT_258834 [Paxillus rubicundulus Ve08.2h10]|uniref:Uncharacterized protein n=1 Tax=Paxillus rubicundulus Ve08.2h10 TaxID=930991 RepID=A0A0D0E6E2_9AGAM|nr:hypothetical protein PAXRUDRAFT_258834 [Paxillus rubicundulus Ve08.2h10]
MGKLTCFRINPSCHLTVPRTTIHRKLSQQITSPYKRNEHASDNTQFCDRRAVDSRPVGFSWIRKAALNRMDGFPCKLRRIVVHILCLWPYRWYQAT